MGADQFILLTVMLVARGGERDNRDYSDEELDNIDYYGDHSDGQVFLTENGDNTSSSELETGRIDVGSYRFRRRGISGES